MEEEYDVPVNSGSPRIVSEKKTDEEKYVKLSPKEKAKLLYHKEVASKYAKQRWKERAKEAGRRTGRFTKKAGAAGYRAASATGGVIKGGFETLKQQATAGSGGEGKGKQRLEGLFEAPRFDFGDSSRELRSNKRGKRVKRGYGDLIGGDFGGVGGFGRFDVGFGSKKGGKKKWSSLI